LAVGNLQWNLWRQIRGISYDQTQFHITGFYKHETEQILYPVKSEKCSFRQDNFLTTRLVSLVETLQKS